MKRTKKSAPKRFKQYNIEDPIYKAQLSIFIGDNKQIKKYLKTCGVHDYGDVQCGKFIPIDRFKIIILNQKDIGTISHEIIHYCFTVLTERGVPVNEETDEAFAYYYEMILINVLKALKIKNSCLYKL